MKERFSENFECLGYLMKTFDRRYLGGKGSYLLGVASLLTMVLSTTDQGNIIRDIENRLDHSHPISTIEPQRSFLLVQRNRQRINLRNMESARFNNNTLLILAGLVGLGISTFLIIRQKQDWIQPNEKPDEVSLLSTDLREMIKSKSFQDLDDFQGPGRRNT